MKVGVDEARLEWEDAMQKHGRGSPEERRAYRAYERVLASGATVKVAIGGASEEHEHHAANDWRLRLGETIGNPECPLMVRWTLETPIGSVRLHKFMKGDEVRALHDHPWWFLTFPLSGRGYMDMTYCWECGGNGLAGATGGPTGYAPCSAPGCVDGRVERHVPAWRLTRRKAGHTHAVQLIDERPVWTFIVTGRKLRHWGFWMPVYEKTVTSGFTWIVTGARMTFFESRKYFRQFGHAGCED